MHSLAAQCDDGNLNDGDGCSALCTLETGFICEGGSPTSPDVCRPIESLSIKSLTVSFDSKVVAYFSHEVKLD